MVAMRRALGYRLRRARRMRPARDRPMIVAANAGATCGCHGHDGRLDEDRELLTKPLRRDDLAHHAGHASGTVAPLQAMAASGAGDAPGGAAEGETAIGWAEGVAALVVEDDPLIRMNLAQMVEIMGLVPSEAGKAETALDWLRKNPAPGLLITDLTLPGMSGIELAVEARRLHPGLPVLLATGHAEGSIALPAELSDGVGFLGKPFAMYQLEQALKALWVKTRSQA